MAEPRKPDNVIVVPGLDAQRSGVVSTTPRAPVNPKTTKGELKGK